MENAPMKTKRQELILDLVRQGLVDTQERLTKLLTEAGYHVTQATVSRDIRELGLYKGQGSDGDYRYLAPSSAMVRTKPNLASSNGIFEIARRSIISVQQAMQLTVVRCRPGLANAVCSALDAMEIPGILGTVSGDDTFFIAAASPTDSERICKMIKDML